MTSWTQLLGAAGFGALIGWFVYYINRYRKSDVQFSDITTVIAIIGGAAVLALFPASTDLFGAYGIGLFLGFFAYFVALLLLIRSSANFSADFLLDGRRRTLDGTGYYIPGDLVRPAMEMQPVRDLSVPAQVSRLAASDFVAVPVNVDELNQAQASIDALRSANAEAQRTLTALTQALQSTGQRPASGLNPVAETGD